MNSLVSSNSDINVDHGDISSCNDTVNTEFLLGPKYAIQYQIDALFQKMDTWDAVLYMPCVQNNCYHEKFENLSMCDSIYKGFATNQNIYLDPCVYSPDGGLMELDISLCLFFCLV